MQVLELRGLESIWAFNAYQTLLRGLALEQACLGQDMETTFANFEGLDLAGKEKELRRALSMVNLEREDMLNLLTFVADVNGIPYAKKNLKNMGPTELMEAMLAVCLKISEINPRLATDDAKKNCPQGV